MGQIEQAIKDVQRIMEDDAIGFAVSLTLYDGNGTPFTLKGTHARHHIQIDEEGAPINSLNAHIAVSTETLDAASYTYKNADNRVDMKNRRVIVADSSGTPRNYTVSQWFPDETLGLIVLILQDRGED